MDDAAPAADPLAVLNPKQQRFVAEYVVDNNATQAAARAGYSAHSAGWLGYQLLQNPPIQAAISAERLKLGEKLAITRQWVVDELTAIAGADPNELIQHQRVCCRYCWGAAFGYQCTPQEMRDRRAEFDKKVTADGAEDFSDEFDEQGGIGYNGLREPNADCPECFGQGVSYAFVPDSRLLSPSALKLYAGVKKTKDGIEIKMKDQVAATLKLGQHLGMFVEQHEFVTPVRFVIEGAPVKGTE